jgi:DNA-binding NarL/FixJ family response regulator
VNCEVIVADAPPEPALKEQLALAQAPALVVLVDLDEVDARTWLARGVSVLPRSADGPTINAAIAAAVAGLVAAPPGLIEDALRPGSLLSAGELYAELTAREIEVLARLASGADNRAIAEALHISPHTAKFHVGQILAKLGASSRTDAVAKAFRARLVASDP